MMGSESSMISCERTADIVSYIYGESVGLDRENFEMHLVDCSICIDELAEISNARFSVYEWNREEFSKLPTPEFIIPYSTALVTKTSSGTIAAIISGWRDLAASLSWPAAVGSFAVFAVILGLGLFSTGVFRTGTIEMARNSNSARPDSTSAIDSGLMLPSPLPANSGEAVTSEDIGSSRQGPDAIKVQPVRTTANSTDLRAKRPARHLEASVSRGADRRNSVRTSSRPPSLSGAEEDVDESLRLSDLFSDSDTLR